MSIPLVLVHISDRGTIRMPSERVFMRWVLALTVTRNRRLSLQCTVVIQVM